MRTFHLAAIVFGSIAGLGSSTTGAAEPAPSAITQRHLHVIVQAYWNFDCVNCGVLERFFVDRDIAARQKFMDTQYALLTEELRHLSVPGLVRETLCRELCGDSAPDCAQVSLVERDALGSAKIASDDIIVAVQIDYAPGTGIPGLRTRAMFSHVSHGGELVQFLDAGSSTPPPKGMRATPMVAASEANSQEKAARKYWWDGAPSRMESELRRGLAESARIARLVFPIAGPDAPQGAHAKWIDSLPKVRDLEKAGKTRCKVGTCGWHYAYVDGDRYWRLLPPPGPLSIGSLPLRAD